MIEFTSNEVLQTTAIPDFFIEKYLTAAPAAYVKVFVYILMLSKGSCNISSASELGSILKLSEDEVAASFSYWEKQGLLKLLGQGNDIAGIELCLQQPAGKSSSRKSLSSLVKDDNDAAMLVSMASGYMGRALNPTEIQKLLYFYDELDFPFELCDYLFEYCVSKGKKNMRYIEKVALSWHEKGYISADEAKRNESEGSKIHFDVLKAFGISGRNPIKSEEALIDKWYEKYCFSIEIISKACAITLKRTGKQSFEYADKILTSWHDAGVKTTAEIERYEMQVRAENKASSSSKKTPKNKNQFHNYQQRDDNLDELQRRLNQRFAEITEDKNGAD